MVHRALVHMLVLPWPEIPDQDQQWEGREAELVALVTGCTYVLRGDSQLETSQGMLGVYVRGNHISVMYMCVGVGTT